MPVLTQATVPPKALVLKGGARAGPPGQLADVTMWCWPSLTWSIVCATWWWWCWGGCWWLCHQGARGVECACCLTPSCPQRIYSSGHGECVIESGNWLIREHLLKIDRYFGTRQTISAKAACYVVLDKIDYKEWFGVYGSDLLEILNILM